MQRGYKVELDLNNKQRTLCAKHAGSARYAYNWGLARKQAAREAGEKSPSAIDLHRELNLLKQGELAWLYEVSKCAPQEALRDLDRAYTNFYRRVKSGKGKPGFPKFKSKKRSRPSFRLTGSIRVSERHIQLPRLGKLRLKEAGYIPQGAKVLSATVSERAGRWFVAVLVDIQQAEPIPATGEPVGCDWGLKTMLVTSDRREYANPHALKRNLKKLARLNRSLHRKQKGSNNREQARKQLARLHYRIACIRQDAIHKATTDVVAKTKPGDQRPCVVVIEDLNAAGMLQNHKLALEVNDVGPSKFKWQFKYKTRWTGSKLLLADRWYPSSKLCSGCGSRKEVLALSERIYNCESCGLVLDRDQNAARNLASLASETTASYAES